MKVSELVEKLLKLPQDAEIVKYSSITDTCGVRPISFSPRVKIYSKETRYKYGSFNETDCTYDTYDVYVEDADGDIEAVEM